MKLASIKARFTCLREIVTNQTSYYRFVMTDISKFINELNYAYLMLILHLY